MDATSHTTLPVLPAAAAQTVLLLDIDGTLAPITDDPAATAVPASTLALLDQARAQFALVGVVTGRSLERAMELVPLDGIWFAAAHGMQLRWADGSVHDDPAALAARDQLQLAVTLAHTVGWKHEDKGVAVTLHARTSPDPERTIAQMRSQAVTVLDSRRVELHDAKLALEVRPVGARTKREGVLELIAQAPGATAVVFVGDDTTDLDAVAGARASGLQSLCLVVDGPETPAAIRDAADALLPSQSDVEPWLRSLLA